MNLMLAWELDPQHCLGMTHQGHLFIYFFNTTCVLRDHQQLIACV